MTYHMLNGDALAYSFSDSNIEGTAIVCREALIDGDVSGNDREAFSRNRANHLGIAVGEYQVKVVSEWGKIMTAPDGSVFNLWFEYDLFCQVNMWYVISLINKLSIKKDVYAVYTSHLGRHDKHFWNGFGPANSSELQACYADRILLSEADLQLGGELWAAYKDNNFEALTRLATKQSAAFPHLPEVVQAHIDRFPQDGTPGRPEQVIADIILQGATDFPSVFREFWKRESIYGFGDTQVKNLYDIVIAYRKLLPNR